MVSSVRQLRRDRQVAKLPPKNVTFGLNVIPYKEWCKQMGEEEKDEPEQPEQPEEQPDGTS